MVNANPLQSFPLVQWTPLCLVNMSWAGSKWLNMCTCADPDSTNGGGETKTKHTSWIAKLEAQRSHFQVLSLGTNTIEMQLVWRIFPATSLVERIFPETSAFWRMLQATSLAMQDMLWNRFAEPQKHRTFQRLSVSPKMFGKKPTSYQYLIIFYIYVVHHHFPIQISWGHPILLDFKSVPAPRNWWTRRHGSCSFHHDGNDGTLDGARCALTWRPRNHRL